MNESRRSEELVGCQATVTGSQVADLSFSAPARHLSSPTVDYIHCRPLLDFRVEQESSESSALNSSSPNGKGPGERHTDLSYIYCCFSRSGISALFEVVFCQEDQA